MKMQLACSALLFSCALVTAQTPTIKSATSKSIDGTWKVICAEKVGQPMADAKDMTVTIKDNVVTCSGKDGKKAMAIKIEFAEMGRAKVTEEAKDGTSVSEKRPINEKPRAEKPSDDKSMTREAVYVLTNDYLAVCIHDTKDGATGRSNTETDNKVNAGPDGKSTQPSGKSYCTLILQRTDSNRKE